MMTTRDSEATRQRLIEAARREFAEFGIAGARVDRIAANAEANKAQIYHYFGSKDQLFAAVWESVAKLVFEGTPIDVDDLPGYAARLSDSYAANPEIHRLVTWRRLERGHEPPLPSVVESSRPTIEEIAKAQASGTVADRFDAPVLFGLIVSIAAMWQTHSPEFPSVVGVSDPKRRREIVRDAVECLLHRWDSSPMTSRIAEALARLTPEQRAVVQRACFQGWTTAQIAADLGIADGTVKSRLHHALRVLRLAMCEVGVTPWPFGH
jgi:AcrR family transcriptional regulator